METVLGLHFGHDAHAVIKRSDQIIAYIQRDRLSRIKNHAGVDEKLIRSALDIAEIHESEVDCIVVTNTQYREFVFESPKYFSWRYAPNDLAPEVDKSFLRNIKNNHLFRSTEIKDAFARGVEDRIRRANLAQYPQLEGVFDRGRKEWRTDWQPYLFTHRESLNRLAELDVSAKSFAEVLQSRREWARENLFIPIVANLGKSQIQGFFVDHHFSHSHSVASISPLENSLVFSSDGSGASILGNLASWKISGEVYPCLHTSFRGGQFYELAAAFLGLECGKFMGLAGYGKSDPYLVSACTLESLQSLDHYKIKEAIELYYGRSIEPENTLSSINSLFAATCQSLFERSLLLYVECLREKTLTLDSSILGLDLTGGSSLNCPANSLLAEKYGTEHVFIEPSCNDEGLGLGAIEAARQLINGKSPKSKLTFCNPIPTPFIGPIATRPSKDALQLCRNENTVLSTRDLDWSEIVAQRLVSGGIGIIMRGRSEVGPRALGNRSIIAYPSNTCIAERVNAFKRRETWRPLAPACLERSYCYFFEGPTNPYMLMTSRAKNLRYPGIIHADGSARVQTVTQVHDSFYAILLALEASINAPAVILNTSLNRKNEAILNNSDIALSFYLSEDFDFILLDEYLILKNN